MPLPYSSSSERLYSLDALRGILVLCVILYHYLALFWERFLDYFSGGFLAVEVFFVLSGYAISRHLIVNNPSFLDFLVRRFLRIYPSLLFLVLFCVILVSLKDFSPFSMVYQEAVYSILSVYNYFLIFKEVPYFERFETELLFLPLWSLSLEFQLYLLSAVLFKLLPRRFLSVAFLSLVFLSASLSFYYFQVLNMNPDKVYFSTEARAHAFFLGGLLALHEERLLKLLELAGSTVRNILFYSTLTLLGFCFVYFDIYRDWFFPFGFLVVDLLALVLIASLVYKREAPTPLVVLGSFSYPLFLWHYPLMLIEKYSDVSSWCFSCSMFVFMFAVASLTHILIEEPFRRRRFTPDLSVNLLLYMALPLYLLLRYEAQRPPYEIVLETRREEPHKTVTQNTASTGPCIAYMIGDSVMAGAAPFIADKYRGFIINARVNRTFKEAFDVIERDKHRIKSCQSLVVHLGHNSYVRRELLERLVIYLRELLGPDKSIYFVTLKADRLRWDDSYNQALKDLEKSSYIKVIDWNAVASEEYLGKDRIHLNTKGAKVYRELVAEALNLDEYKKDGLIQSVVIKHSSNAQKPRVEPKPQKFEQEGKDKAEPSEPTKHVEEEE